MEAVTESLPIELLDIFSPPSRGDLSIPDAFIEASSHATSHWYPSARTALQAALRDAGIESDDDVLIPAYTCHAVDKAVSEIATPVYVDTQQNSTIDLTAAATVITSETEAIVPTHLYGIECDMEAVRAFADEHDIVVIEDAAQALANLFTGSQVGQYADYTVFSFRFYKEITGFTGGLLLGAERLREKRHTEEYKRAKLAGVWLFHKLFTATPGRLYQPLREYVLDPFARSADAPEAPPAPTEIDEWTQRVLSVQLTDIEQRVETRRHNASIYETELPDPLQRVGKNRPTSMFRYPIRVPAGHRDALLRQTRRCGVGCSPMYAYTVSPTGQCPMADTLADEILNIPVHGGLSPRQVSEVAKIVRESWDAIT